MPAAPIDPFPRTYPPAVTLVRRLAPDVRLVSVEPETVDDIEAWLLGDAMRVDDLLALFASLVSRLVSIGLPLDRASLHVGTLHPQLFGFAWNWNRADGLFDEVRVDSASLKTDSYRRSPLCRVIEQGESFRGDTGDPASTARFPFLSELAGQGIVEYIALPLGGGGAYHNAATVATGRKTGFSEQEFALLRQVLRLFALHVERHIILRIAANVLDTYLGNAAGHKVLDGSIKRGDGEAIRAIVWMSDLRDFTHVSNLLTGPEVTALLNACFEPLVAAVFDHGGDVLKFIGDGLLAVFPLTGDRADHHRVAEAALVAAQQAHDAIQRLNTQPSAALRAMTGWHPLRMGVALHEGTVFFGNVGAPDRLDFTVIGRTVNEASRVEALCKTLGRDILITEPVARLLETPLDDLGQHALRGVTKPVSIFSPAGSRQTGQPNGNTL